jgi:recombination associated protein RdgC
VRITIHANILEKISLHYNLCPTANLRQTIASQTKTSQYPIDHHLKVSSRFLLLDKFKQVFCTEAPTSKQRRCKISRFSSPLGQPMWFKNLQVFRLPAPWKVDVEQLNMQLASQAFANTGSGDMQSEGWASPRGNDQLIHSVNQQLLLLLQNEKKLLPSSVVNQVTKARAKELEEQQGFAPGRKAMKDLKERVTDELLPRAFAITRQTWVWIDPVNGWLVIDSSSPSKADEVIKLLLKCDKIPMESLRTKISPQTAMTDWLAGNEAPKGFTIDQDTELRAHTEDKATVRYVRHSIDPDDVQRHIAAGKQCTKLAMTWDDKISFILSENLAIKRIKPLDILNEDKDQRTADENERFDADFLLMTSELAKMIDDIVFSLGGQLADPLAA